MSATTKRPTFAPELTRGVANARNGAVYRLVRADALDATPERLLEVTRGCNEPRVYEWLFRERLRGEPYAPEQAAIFFEWARAGWREGAHFVFLPVKIFNSSGGPGRAVALLPQG